MEIYVLEVYLSLSLSWPNRSHGNPNNLGYITEYNNLHNSLNNGKLSWFLLNFHIYVLESLVQEGTLHTTEGET